MNNLGGEIEFIIESGQSHYKGTKSFGIISYPRDNYVRSFKFIGNKSVVYYKYKENFKSSINENWDNRVFYKVKYATDNLWEFKEFKYFDKNLNEYKKINSIHHKGKLKAISKNDLGSFLLLKDVEFNNGIIKSNFYFKDSNLFAILFRFQDKENFYSIEFSLKDLKDNIRLVQKVNGSSSIVKSDTLVLSLDTWYRLSIIMENDLVKVYLQTNHIRENKKIFETDLPDISRGSIGFASNGNYESYINGIEINEYIPHSVENRNDNREKDSINKRTWVDYLKKVDPKNVKKFCKEIFLNESEEEITRCKMPQNFCKIKCDDYIPTTENILNFQCYKNCVQKIKGNDEEVKKKETYKPKIGDMIDFKAKGSSKYSAGKIISGRIKKTNKNIEIFAVSYITDAGEQKVEICQFPNKMQKIKKCASELPKRKDC